MAKNPDGRIDWKLLTPLVLGTMMNPLNSTMLATALATICNHFAREAGDGALLITPLYVAATVGQPLMGRLADLYNPKTINKLGFILVFIAALTGVFARSFSWLIVSRVILGLGTSAAYPSAMAIVAHKYQSRNRIVPGNVLGIIAVSSQVSMVLGPLLGGFLTQAFGWQGVFLINIPWVIIGLYLSKKNIPSIPKLWVKQGSALKTIDAAGVFLMATWLILLFICLTQDLFHWLPFVLLCCAFSGFILWENQKEDPFIDIRLLRHKPSLLLVYIRTLATNYVLYLLLYALPQWIEAVKQMTPGQTGGIMLPMSAVSAISAILISRKRNLFKINTAGLVTMFFACAGIFLLQSEFPVTGIIGINMLCGLAVGINMFANQASLSAEAPAEKTGASFGLYRTFGYIGAIISGTQLKMLFRHGVTDRSLHTLGWYAVISCVVMSLLYLTTSARDRKIRTV